MCRTRIAFVIMSVVAVMFPTGALAQNLLANPDFDIDVSGWSGLGWWDPMDIDDSAASGSGTWINDWAAGGSLYLLQCAEIPVSVRSFDLIGYVFIPSGQAGQGESMLNLVFYSDAECSDLIYGVGTSTVTGFDTWHPMRLTGWIPPNALSARVGLQNQKTAPGDYQVFHDAIFFGPNPEMIFADGFETTDTSGWSAVGIGRKYGS